MHRPFTTTASVLTLGLFLYGLIPFDFITDTAQLHTSFLQAVWMPQGVRADGGATALCPGMVEQFVGAAWFALLGYTLTWAGWECGYRRVSAALWAVQQGCVIVAVTEALQLFIRSHLFDLVGMLIATGAVFLGAWLALSLGDWGQSAFSH